MEVAMNASERIAYPLVDAVADALAAAWSKLEAFFEAYAQIRGRAAAVRALHQLSDRTLRDIGLERADIEEAVRRGRRS
jgi:uncharacterized protein YjiS (DUF1127 family)